MLPASEFGSSATHTTWHDTSGNYTSGNQFVLQDNDRAIRTARAVSDERIVNETQSTCPKTYNVLYLRP